MGSTTRAQKSSSQKPSSQKPSSQKSSSKSSTKTATSSFGTSKREGHNADAFYERFPTPNQDQELTPQPPEKVDELLVGDSRNMKELADNSVALVVTSPPYFAGKEYELEPGSNGVPASYIEYLKMLADVFSECWRVLEPGGRIAVNVANLGRRPYRSLSADVARILQDDVGYLLRGEVIWQKSAGSNSNCAWGSFQSAANPVLRDVTERVIIASKLRFDRAMSRKQRQKDGLPHENSISKEDFMEWTLDVWQIAPESARRVGHPAPFPVELPKRLIELYTYEKDLVLDPFVGAGTTALAAKDTNRHYWGYDTDSSYITLAEKRLQPQQKNS